MLVAAGRSVTVSRRVVVHALTGGIVGGSGAILSPQRAFTTAPLKSGKASFRFLTPAAAGARGGQLQFDLAGWRFRSASMRAATGGDRGRFEGNGTVNGRGDYKFSLDITAGATARFGLRIWHLDAISKAPVVDYDNQTAAPGAGANAVMQGTILQR